MAWKLLESNAIALPPRTGPRRRAYVKSLKQILALTGGVTSRIFSLVKDLSIDAIVTGQECITDDAVAKWTPVWSRHANAQRRLEKAGA